jgi:hypothetical protein
MAGSPNLPKENIDEVILGLLALEPNEVAELDYQIYSLYLRELLIEVTSARRKISGAEVELIKNEFKRVRGKKGRFKIVPKSSKVTANGLGLGGIRKQIKGAQKRLMLAPVGGVPKETRNKIDSDLDVLSRINNTLDSIIKTLTDINKDSKKRSDRERKDAESKRRLGKEKEFESKIFDGIKKVVSTITKPFQSVWDKIVNFIKNIILGRILIKLVDWFADPQNQGKIKNLIRFFKDWWPAILGSYVLFGTTFGRFIRGTVGLIGRFIFQIGKVAIPKLLKFINTPLGKAVALFTAGATIPAMFPGTVNEQERKTSQSSGSTQDKIKQLQQQKANLNIFERLQGKGAEIDEQLEYLKTGKTKSYGFNGGGSTYGLVRGPKGRDKVPAWLTDGEFVVSAGAVNKYGVETFEAMNAAGGGTNKPQIVNGTTYAYGGGLIGSGGNNKNQNDPTKSIKDFIKFKLGYDVDRPSTWGSSFGAGISGMSGGSGFKMSGPNLNQIGNQAYKSINNTNLQKNILDYGQRKLSDITSSGSKILAGAKNKVLSVVDSPLAALEKYGTERENALVKSGELKPGAALTKTAQANLNKSDAWIKSLYDPKKDKGPLGFVKKAFQDVQNKGLLSDPFAMLGLKEEGTEKFVEKISGGRVKNLGAKITGLQYALKGLAGPLGKAFRIDDRGSLGRYVRPAMLEAQKMEQGGVGAVGLGQEKYNKLMGDKLANLALGQFNFNVDKKGRATTNDTYEGNKPASEYFKGARSALKKGDIAGALFKGVSGVLRINQNTGWGNLRPGGSGIDLGGGFTPTDKNGKPIPPTKSSGSVSMYGANDPRRKQSGPYKSKFSRPKNAGVKPVKPLPKPKPKPSATPYTGGQRGSGARPSNSQRPRTQNPTHSASSTRTARSTLGVNKK